MTELHQPDSAKSSRVQLAREAAQDVVRVLMGFVDECCEVAFGVEWHALIPERARPRRGCRRGLRDDLRRRSRPVDDLELGELGKSFLGEFGADAGLLGAAERDMRRHVEML